MARIIRDARIVEDDWSLIDEATTSAFEFPAADAKLIVPLPLYIVQRQWKPLENAQGRLGLLLGPDDQLDLALPFLAQASLIAIKFPSFTDGRGYSLGRLIRMRHGFLGELRAVGDILRDQLYFLAQCGFNAFDLRSDQNLDEALRALGDYAWHAGTVSRTDNLHRLGR